MKMIVSVYLLWGAWQDVRSRKIKNNYLWLGGCIGIMYRIINITLKQAVWEKWLWALIPGVVLLVIAKITKERIGLGDGWLVLVLGNFLSIGEICCVLQLALFLVFVFSIFLLWIKKISRKFEMPFLPFLCAAYIVLWGFDYV